MNTEFLLFAALHLSCLVIRMGYELLKKAGRLNPKSTPLFVAIFSIMMLLWASWFSICPVDPMRLALPDLVRWIGLGAVIVGLVLAIGGVVQLRGVENIDHLVTTGLYNKLRHPMYTGFILWVLGWAIFHGALVSLVIGCVTIANILYWRGLEEENLRSAYGEMYQQYCQSTWF